MFDRLLSLTPVLKERSAFLFGPRMTGKTTLLRQRYSEALWINLLEADTYRDFVSRPELLRQMLKGNEKFIVIDEIQRVPALLNEVHTLIETHKKLRFILTGSSARRLKEGGVNLLAGRARTLFLHPLTSAEVGVKSIQRLMLTGGLPSIFNSSSPDKDLKSYLGTYLQEEIRAEALVRSTERFSRFLEVSGLCNGQVINFSKVGADSGVPPRTIIEYFRILEDTLIGKLLPPFQKTRKRKSISASKFYLFDMGVANQLLKRKSVEPGSEIYGAALEHLIFTELRAYLDYSQKDVELNFWRSQSQQEVDFVVGDTLAVEVKASSRIGRHEEKSLIALGEEFPKMRKIIVCDERRYRKTDTNIEIFPIGEFLQELWKNEFDMPPGGRPR